MNETNINNTMAPFAVKCEDSAPGAGSGMKSIFETSKGTSILAMRQKDVGTLVSGILVTVADGGGGVSPVQMLQRSKLKNPKSMERLADIDGITLEDIPNIHKALLSSYNTLNVQLVGESKCSLVLSHQRLTEYVASYTELERVFTKDGYGCIEATYLQKVIDKLELGYTCLELERNFKVWGLLRSSDKSGHYYTYKIGRKYYFSFKLADLDSTEGGEQA